MLLVGSVNITEILLLTELLDERSANRQAQSRMGARSSVKLFHGGTISGTVSVQSEVQ